MADEVTASEADLADSRDWVDVYFSIWKLAAVCAFLIGYMIAVMLVETPEQHARVRDLIFASVPSKVFQLSVCSLFLALCGLAIVRTLSRRPYLRIAANEIRSLQLTRYKTVVRGRWWLSEKRAPVHLVPIDSDAGETVLLGVMFAEGGKRAVLARLREAARKPTA